MKIYEYECERDEKSEFHTSQYEGRKKKRNKKSSTKSKLWNNFNICKTICHLFQIADVVQLPNVRLEL